MKIAVCGSGLGESKEISEKAKEIGREIAKSNNILLTGGGTGYPYSAVRGAILEKGKVICYSPAKNKEEHINKYRFPFEQAAEYIFTNMGIPRRNLPLVQNADAVIIIGGQIGTLNEFTIAFAESLKISKKFLGHKKSHSDFFVNKKIGILEGSGGIIELIPQLSSICDKRGESKNIVYSSDAKELVKKILGF